MQQAGGADHPERNAEKLHERNGKNAEDPGSKAHEEGKIGEDNVPLQTIGHLPAGKDITTVFDGEKENGPEN